MTTLPVKDYNAIQVKKWHIAYTKAKKRDLTLHELPKLISYLFDKNYGYVTFEEARAVWAKSKIESIIKF